VPAAVSNGARGAAAGDHHGTSALVVSKRRPRLGAWLILLVPVTITVRGVGAARPRARSRGLGAGPAAAPDPAPTAARRGRAAQRADRSPARTVRTSPIGVPTVLKARSRSYAPGDAVVREPTGTSSPREALTARSARRGR
jgi:hypothetical protein